MKTLLEQPIRVTCNAATAGAERIPGVKYDANGNPILYTVEETFDHIDARIIEHYGDGARSQLNAIRMKYGMRPLPTDFSVTEYA
jgi:hypothetical protein